MPQVPIDEIPAGAILEEAVVDAEGRILLRRGAALTPAVRSRLDRWGVTSVNIVIEHAAPSGNATFETVRERWESLFRCDTTHPELELIHNGLKRWHERYQGGDSQECES